MDRPEDRPDDIPEAEGDEDTFSQKVQELKEKYVQQIRTLCGEYKRDFKETLEASIEDMPAVALRCRKYTPTEWVMALRLAGKEMPAELKVGGKELHGQYARYAKEHIYHNPARKEELEEMLATERRELEAGVDIRTDSVKVGTAKALKHLKNSVMILLRA
jgi:hypothetical protein